MLSLFNNKVLLIFVVLFVFPPQSVVHAQMDDWSYLEPESQAFEARFPTKRTVKENRLRINDDTVLFISEYTANIKERGEDKTYMVKLEQKIGKPLKSNMIAFALASDTARYRKLAETLNGKMITEADLNLNQFRGKDFFIAYKKDNKNMGMRIRVLLTDISRIYLITNGIAETSYSYKATNFFDKIKLFDGNATIPGKLNDEWVSLASPTNIFTIKSPEKGNLYISDFPVFSSNNNSDFAHISFVDPILKHRMHYSVKSYVLDKTVSEYSAKELMARDFISKYVKNVSSKTISSKEEQILDNKILSVRISVSPTKEDPSVNFLMLEAQYNKNHLVIQQVAGPGNYVLSPLGLSLLASMKFHPEKFSGGDDTAEVEIIPDE